MKKVILTQVVYVTDEKKLRKAAARADGVIAGDLAAAVLALAVKPPPGCELADGVTLAVDRISTTDHGAADRREDEQLVAAARARLRAAGRLDDPDDFGFGPAGAGG